MTDSPLRPIAAFLGWLDFQFGSPPSAALASLFAVSCFVAQPTQAECANWAAEVIAAEGTIEVRRADRAWAPVAPGMRLCAGDSVRVQRYSRATVRLPDETVLRYDEHTTLIIGEARQGFQSWIDLLRGAIHVISRDPRSLKFSTPYMNAGLEGTEFVIRVNASNAEVAVLEGEVAMENPYGEVRVLAGQVGSAGQTAAPVAAAVAEPLDYMRWGSYYPPIMDGPLPEPGAELPSVAAAESLARRAAARLAVGQVDEAEADLASALAADPGHADAQALTAIVALQQKDFARAAAAVDAALRSSGDSPAALIAASYVRHARGEHDAALAAAQRAAELAPGSAVALARLAELQLERGEHQAGRAAAQRAISLDPQLGYARAVRGFAHLRELRPEEALEEFDNALVLDPASPLARLGLGLAREQRDGGAAGRPDIELAVIQDPANSTVRSYMGKAYGAENRADLTATLLGLAAEFDAKDVTPPLYNALQKQAENRPVEALDDFQAAVERNAGVPVFRSSFLLDEDLATRSAGIGRLYRDLGFERLAMLDGWLALAADPTNYSAHRLLADVYSTEPLHELARANELFISQLWQPINVTPVPAQLGQPTSFLMESIAPRELAFSEFQPLMTRNGPRFEGSAMTGAHDTFGEQLTIAGLHDRLSYSVGQFRFETDGFRPNNDMDQRIANALVQYRPSAGTTVLAELRSSNLESGDPSINFDRDVYLAGTRVAEETDSLRVGVRRDLPAGGTILATAVYQDASGALSTGIGSTLEIAADALALDLQHTRKFGRWRLTSGLERAEQRVEEIGRDAGTSAVPPFVTALETTTRDAPTRSTLYAYANWEAADTLTVTFGTSADDLDSNNANANTLNPKLGVMWRPLPRTTVRAAFLQTTHASLTTSRQNVQPRLEPVQIAGFNQYYFGSDGEESTLRGVGLDQQLSRKLFAGVQWHERDVDRPFGAFGTPGVPVDASTRVVEEAQRGYLYWTPTPRMSFSAEYSLEQMDSDSAALFGFTDTKIRRLPLEVRYFTPEGWTAGLKASRILQEGTFPFADTASLRYGEEAFWMVDASVAYRLPKRRGTVSLNVANLLDEEFRFQEIDPGRLSYVPERTAFLRFTLAFH